VLDIKTSTLLVNPAKMIAKGAPQSYIMTRSWKHIPTPCSN
jgi:hypothetical protein